MLEACGRSWTIYSESDVFTGDALFSGLRGTVRLKGASAPFATEK